MDINSITSQVIKAAIIVHRELGPGLLESVYQRCLQTELLEMGLSIASEVPVSIQYKGQFVQQEGFRMDLLVEDKVIVELKSLEKLRDVHEKQLLTYLKLTDKRIGLLINFNEFLLKKGIVRIANGYSEQI